MSTIRDTNRQAPTQDANPDEERSLSLCSLLAGGCVFGIDTRTIKEVLTKNLLRKVPLAPAYIGGIVSYRGEVLTTISFRVLLGLEPLEGESCVMVLEEDENGERFGLVVDSVGNVIVVDRRNHISNPSTLDERSAALYDGVFQTSEGIVILLTSKKLRPASLGSTTFQVSAKPVLTAPTPSDLDQSTV